MLVVQLRPPVVRTQKEKMHLAKAFLREVARERKKCQLAPEHTALGYVHGFLHSKALSAAATVRQSTAAAEIWPGIIMPQVQCHARRQKQKHQRKRLQKQNHSAHARTLTSPKGSTCRDVQKIEVIVARGVGGQMNPSNSSTFHIPASKLHLVLRVSLMGAHQFGEGTDFKYQSVLSNSMGDEADMPPRLQDVSHGGGAPQISGNSTMIS